MKVEFLKKRLIHIHLKGKIVTKRSQLLNLSTHKRHNHKTLCPIGLYFVSLANLNPQGYISAKWLQKKHIPTKIPALM
jgi:hypothetical protein